ncbi:c-type cytochrome [Pseudohalocynthiibacter aestuariivivens]|uniref:C-type cytochrome n=1 Tax=Pseudohalocynthiibacter aestuariivivens TaxID=1591409 RepID=A0ABV5JHP7_9RHOB|nr:cytochrome c [Pseudohalocynthiibacter aestuariivivens]MBS9715314.1 cytochrome c [Pseudohalocynthiibacter aestuariivivens]
MNWKGYWLIGCAMAALGVFGAAAPVVGHGGASGVVKERMELMERYEELADRLFAMAHGELPYSQSVVRNAAAELRETSGGDLVGLFPEGSLREPSEASPKIWEDSVSFSHFADLLRDFATLLEENPAPSSDPSLLPRKWEDVPVMGGMMHSGGMMGGRNGTSLEAGLWRVAHACNSCHEQFREDERR